MQRPRGDRSSCTPLSFWASMELKARVQEMQARGLDWAREDPPTPDTLSRLRSWLQMGEQHPWPGSSLRAGADLPSLCDPRHSVWCHTERAS